MRRFSEATAVALTTGDDAPGISAFLSAEDALERVIEQITEEKAPRIAAPAPGHVEQFGDELLEVFDDDDEALLQQSTYRSDARYLLDVGAEDVDQDGKLAEVDGSFDRDSPIDDGESDVVEDDRAPVSSAVESESEHGVVEPVNADNESSFQVAAVDVGADGDVPDAGAEPSASDLIDEPAGEINVQLPGSGDAQVPQWEWSSKPAPTTTSPWGNAQELVASLPAPATAPVPGDSSGDVTAELPTPSSRATEPPANFDEPEPETGPSLKSRLGEALSDQWRQLRVDPKAAAKKIGIGLAAVLLITVIVMSFMGGGRGKPPVPADVAAPPPQVENTTPPVKEVTLVPATVSTSCGNDSDAVAPFANDKTRAWVCNRINGIDLNVLNITFNKPVVITAITIVPGFNYLAPDGRDEWSRHRVVTDVSWRMGGGLYPQEHILPTRTGVTQKFPDVRTLVMSMTITGSARPPVGKSPSKGSVTGADDAQDPKKVDETTAVSKIVITGYPVESDGGGLAPPSAGK
ncbi:F5/8 type C domain-containing protein [Mycobacteroides abscessus subsp. bolletii]|nr:F5/8 type C domain-containing protein [Mycobacteroides abscessus]SKF61081.1 F5/8 type C domain-containing protein [Mycobacteroides abscessus subsp. bolletii]SKH64678.1 F5/8 type C domain-containing protein [Mycobacteroides abscessus subsp. bolletii]